MIFHIFVVSMRQVVCS